MKLPPFIWPAKAPYLRSSRTPARELGSSTLTYETKLPSSLFQASSSSWQYPLHKLDSIETDSGIYSESKSLRSDLFREETINSTKHHSISDLEVCCYEYRLDLLGPINGAVFNKTLIHGEPVGTQNDGINATFLRWPTDGIKEGSLCGSKYSLLRDRKKRVQQHTRVRTTREANLEHSRPVQPRSVQRAEDEIDEVVLTFLADTYQVGRLKRVSYGVYLLGNKRVGISVKNGKPLVRIGGGAMIHLDLYLVNHS